MEFSAQQLAGYLNGKVIGNPEIKVSDFSKIEEGKPGTLTFLSNPKYTEYIYTTKASIVLVNSDFTPEKEIAATLIQVPNSYAALASLLNMVENMQPKKKGVSSMSVISQDLSIGENHYIGDFVVIESQVKIGTNVQIYPHVYIGDKVVIGDNVTIYPGVRIYKNCIIGNNCIIQSGAVIGSDGFGFAPDGNGVYHKIPQIGNVVLEDNVEVGANTTIDRATMGSTVVKKGAKLDNLVQIAHNVEIGENTVMAALVGIAGSTKVGKNCMFGGQSGAVGHLSIADGSIFAARAGVSKTIKEPNQAFHGYPHMKAQDFQKSFACYKQLPDMRNKIFELEKQLKELKELINKD
jgi:UDP-3-O-[3-hydroxymyristoyl] glucosamine N-acyltransferase